MEKTWNHVIINKNEIITDSKHGINFLQGKEVQNFMTVIVYENYEERFKRKISEISVEDNNKNEKS
jgi:hypothetical protein